MNRFIKIIQKLQVEYISKLNFFDVAVYNKRDTGVSVVVIIGDTTFCFYSFWDDDKNEIILDELKNYLKELRNGRKNDTSREA